ncbi:MAG: FAD-binding protein [Alphaproteobacteria bacterium]|nr:FAD-binding protein [Alphaproteobacteria bacterium]
MTRLHHTYSRLSRRSLLGGVLGVTAVASYPLRQAHAGEALASTGEKILLTDNDLMDLQNSISGPVILPTSLIYDEVRRLWNPAVDHHPAVIAQWQSLEDIQAALQFARSHNILTAIRCGGHNYHGLGMADGGMTIDLSPFRGVEVDEANKVAYVKGGSILRNLDEATIPLGVATTAGVVSHTGVGGLATGIGQGRLARSLGYTIDNVRGVKILTPDGRHLRADATQNSDLYWGVRGGGSNFGIVTEFEIQLYDFDPTVTSISYTYPISKAADVYKTLFEMGEVVPNAMSLGGGVRTNANGETTCSLGGNYAGPMADAQKILDPYIKKLGDPLRTRMNEVDYLWLQGIADGDLLAKSATYYQSGFFNHVDEKIAEEVADYATQNTFPGSQVQFGHQAGKMAKVAPDATAFPHRDTKFQFTTDVHWADRRDGPANKKFANDTWAAVKPMSSGGFYVNLAFGPSEADIREAYAGNYDRLVEVKNKYDPDNFMRLNVNIKPTTAG